MASGRRAPLNRNKNCSRGSVKIKAYKVTKKIKKKGSRKKVTIKYSVSAYCRKKPAGSKRKAAPSRRRKASSKASSRASANFVCQSKSTKKFTRRTANGQCRKGSKKIRI